MKITYGPVLDVVDLTPEDKVYRVELQDEKVIDFSASSGWTITKVSMTKDRRTLVLTVEKMEGDEDEERLDATE